MLTHERGSGATARLSGRLFLIFVVDDLVLPTAALI